MIGSITFPRTVSSLIPRGGGGGVGSFKYTVTSLLAGGKNTNKTITTTPLISTTIRSYHHYHHHHQYIYRSSQLTKSTVSTTTFTTVKTLVESSPNNGFKRFNTRLPERVDGRDPLDNSLKNRIPKFPFQKEAQPSIIPKNTPRVSKNFTFRKLMQTLKAYNDPELLYMAESHRLWLISCLALSFIVCYNIFDLLDRALPAAYDEWKANAEDLPPVRNLVKTIGNLGLVLIIASVYASAAICFAMIPTRLVRRLYYLPGPKEHIQFITHPFLPGRPSPVITLPIENVHIGKTSKVWTGQGFYGTAQRTQFMFLLFEKGKFVPWIVDRSGWFWGDGRVWDVLFGKEPIEQAELGLSYDDMLKIQQKQVKQATFNLKQELGPAWKIKAMAKLMKEDLSSAGKTLGITSSSDKQKSIHGQNVRPNHEKDNNNNKKSSVNK